MPSSNPNHRPLRRETYDAIASKTKGRPTDPRRRRALVNAYPAHEERDVVLRSGSTLRLRPIRPDDERALLAFYERLSPDSLYFRFFSLRHLDAAAAARICAVDYENQFALVGEVGGKIVAISQYFRFPKHPERAEAAFVVEDALQGQGIGTRLLERLAEIARDRGIRSFEADVLPQNTRMLDVFRNCGFAEQERRFEFGSQKVLLDITPTPAYEQHAADRSEAAAFASMRRLFEPGVVAVVGASAERGKIGAEIFHNLRSRFRGTVVPVNRKHREVLGARCYPRVTDVAGPVDLAVIAIPAAAVEAAVDGLRREGRRRNRRHHGRVRGDGRGGAPPRGGPAREGAASPASAWSGPTAWVCSTPTRGFASTRRSRRPIRRRAAWPSLRRAEPSASRCSTSPTPSTSASPASCPSATRPTCRATT